MRRIGIQLAGAVLLAIGLTACGQASNGTSTAPEVSGKIDAETTFKSNCVTCHGADLSGGVGPNLQKVGVKLSQEQITAKIKEGGGGMPPFKNKIKDEDVQTLAMWLAAKK